MYLDYRTAFLGQRLERGGPWPVQASKSRAGKIRQCLRRVRTSLSLSYHSVVVQDADTILIHSNPHQSVLLRGQLGRLQKQKKPIRPTVRDSEPKYFLGKKVCLERNGQSHRRGKQRIAFIQHRNAVVGGIWPWGSATQHLEGGGSHTCQHTGWELQVVEYRPT